MTEWLLPLIGVLIVIAALAWELRTQRLAWTTQRRQKRDVAFAMQLREQMLRGRRRRPKVDRKIQRRRFAR